MTPTRTLDGLRAEIERCGYFPELVSHDVEAAVGAEPVTGWVVHHEATFDTEMEVRRHVTVLVLTEGRLLVHHTDDHPASDSTPVQATTSIESVPLRGIQSVLLSTVVPEPAKYVAGAEPAELTLTVSWGIVGRVDLEPASCGDENCDADHGYAGQVTSDDLTLRVSAAGEGEEAVRRLRGFANLLSAATSHG